MMWKKNQNWKIVALLVTGCLLAASLPAQTKPPQQQDPTKPPMDAPVPEGITPENPWERHAEKDQNRLRVGAKGRIHMREVPLSDPHEVRPLTSPIQGNPPAAEGTDLGGSVEAQETLPEPILPEDIDHKSMDWKAVGDFVASFEGINQNTDATTAVVPPDTVLAVGPNHVLEAVNRGFAVYTKNGAVSQAYRSFENFFQTIRPSVGFTNYFDPRVIYDSFHDQWVMLALGVDFTAQESYVFLAVSSTDDPTGFWFLYRYQVDTGSNTDYWLDYASLGADNWGVYFTGNYFKWSNNDFKYATIFTVGPAVFNGGSGAGWQFWNLKWTGLFPSKAFGIQVAHPHSQSSSETFFVNTKSGSGNDLLLWELTGDRTNSPSLNKSKIGMRSYDSVGNNVDQPNTAVDIDGGDVRVQSAVYSQRRVWATLGSAPNNNSAGWITVKVNVDSTNKEWDTLLWGGDNVYYIYPAITISGGTSSCARIGLAGSWTNSTDRFASGLFKIYDGCNTTAGPFISFIAGQDTYNQTAGGRNRWGDYSGAAYDWSEGTFWGAVEYAGAGNTWRTRITARRFAPDLVANFSYNCNSLSCSFYNASSGGVLPLTSYQWSFTNPNTSGSGTFETHTFNYPGSFPVTLTVTDSTGATSSRTNWVNVVFSSGCEPWQFCDEE